MNKVRIMVATMVVGLNRNDFPTLDVEECRPRS